MNEVSLMSLYLPHASHSRLEAYKPQEFRDTPADFEVGPIVLFRMTVIILLLLVLAFSFSDAEDNGKSGNNSCCFPTVLLHLHVTF
jgi:hypothetical protein